MTLKYVWSIVLGLFLAGAVSVAQADGVAKGGAEEMIVAPPGVPLPTDEEEEDYDDLIRLSEAVVTVPIQPGVSFDEAVESMKLRANQLNIKFVAHQPLSQEYAALGLSDIRRTEIFQFCDASIAKQMLDFDINFLAYMPCRIGMIEDKKGKGWLVTMNLNIFITAVDLPKELNDLAIKVRDDLEQIIEAGATGAL